VANRDGNSVPVIVTHCRYPGTELDEDESQVLIPNLTIDHNEVGLSLANCYFG
jgi:hypothetical protein